MLAATESSRSWSRHLVNFSVLHWPKTLWSRQSPGYVSINYHWLVGQFQWLWIPVFFIRNLKSFSYYWLFSQRTSATETFDIFSGFFFKLEPQAKFKLWVELSQNYFFSDPLLIMCLTENYCQEDSKYYCPLHLLRLLSSR